MTDYSISIEFLRGEFNLSQRELADAMGMPLRTYEDLRRKHGFKLYHYYAVLWIIGH